MHYKYYLAGLDRGKDVYHRCIELARKSDCEKRKFGSVIALEEYGLMAPGEPDITSIWGEGYNKKVCSGLDCCKVREKFTSGTRTEYCEAIHAEMMALQDVLHHTLDVSNITLYVAGLNGDGLPFDNSKGFYCLPCAKELYHAGVKKIALVSADTPETGGWIYVTIEEAVEQSLEFTKGTKTVSSEEDVLSQACKIVDGWSDSKRAAWEQRTGLKLPFMA